MVAGQEPRCSAPPRFHASARPAGRGAWRPDRCRFWPSPRLSSRRDAASSGRASGRARLPGPLRCLAPHAPRTPMEPCLAATPSAGPAPSTKQHPGRTRGHQLFLVRPPGHPGRLPGQRRARCSSWRGQAQGSRYRQVPKRVRMQSHRSASPRPNDCQAHQLDPAVLPARCSTLPPWAASQSPDPGRRGPSRLRSTPGRGVHGRPVQLLFRRGLSRSSAIGQVRRTRSARTAPHLRATPPQPPVPRWPARRRQRRNAPCCSDPGAQTVPPSRSRLVENQPELPRPMALPPLQDVAAVSPGRSALSRSESAPGNWPRPGTVENHPTSEAAC